ncbi:alpha-hydroxy-acid oxidizing protein [Virgibacillus kimchii]
MKANLKAFMDWQIIPRMLRNVDKRDLSVNLFGQTGTAYISTQGQRVLPLFCPDLQNTRHNDPLRRQKDGLSDKE